MGLAAAIWRPRRFASEASDETRILAGIAELYLNALPLTVEGAVDGEAVLALARDDERDRELSRHEERGRSWQHYAYATRSYAWSLTGDALPDAFRADGQPVKLAELPAAVVAFAAREAAAGKLTADGFDRRRNSIGMPARLSRRRLNLAAKVMKDVPKGVGAFAAIALQGLPLVGDGSAPGGVALVVDQWVEHRLPVPLDQLVDCGIEPLGLRVRWQHKPGCRCRSRRAGDAGRVVGGDPGGTVTVVDAGVEHEAPAACLVPHASESMLAKYMASVNGRTERDIDAALRRVLGEFSEVASRWEKLEQTARNLGTLQLFPEVTATAGMPLAVPLRQNLAGMQQPVALQAVPEGTLNFGYGAPKLVGNAAQGLRQHGPYDEHQERQSSLRAVVVAPQAFEADAQRLRTVLADGVQAFQGLRERYKLAAFSIEVQLFDGTGPDAYRAGVLAAASSDPDIVFVVIQHGDRYAKRGQNPYLAAKAALGSAGISSQAITVEKLRQPAANLQWIADSVSLAAYAKVGNVPYVLHDPEGGRELVLGVGRADLYDPKLGRRKQRFGASVAVRQDGDFLFSGSTTPVSTDDDYEQALAELLDGAIKTYEVDQGALPERIVVYLFKRTGRRELYAIKKAIGDRDIQFALLHVNRDSPLWLVDRAGQRVRAPQRGTQVAISLRDRLIVTGDPKKPGAAHPLRLVLDDRSTYRDTNRLVRQAYGFTKTSYRTFLPSNEPSPILFGRLLAEKLVELAPYGFNPATAAGPFGRKPWFL